MSAGADEHATQAETGTEASGSISSSLTEAPPEDERDRIEQERQERLDADNRPDGAEVDNTDREFDETRGVFTDSEDYEDADERFPPAAEQGI